jgi:hypothetical protein
MHFADSNYFFYWLAILIRKYAIELSIDRFAKSDVWSTQAAIQNNINIQFFHFLNFFLAQTRVQLYKSNYKEFAHKNNILLQADMKAISLKEE